MSALDLTLAFLFFGSHVLAAGWILREVMRYEQQVRDWSASGRWREEDEP